MPITTELIPAFPGSSMDEGVPEAPVPAAALPASGLCAIWELSGHWCWQCCWRSPAGSRLAGLLINAHSFSKPSSGPALCPTLIRCRLGWRLGRYKVGGYDGGKYSWTRRQGVSSSQGTQEGSPEPSMPAQIPGGGQVQGWAGGREEGPRM